MKAKRKSLGELVWDLCYSVEDNSWPFAGDKNQHECRSIASRIRREVIKRELEKAEHDLGVRAIHGERLERARLMLESRHTEKAQAAAYSKPPTQIH